MIFIFIDKCPLQGLVGGCPSDLCNKVSCLAFPDAKCHVNHCDNKCEVEFYDKDNRRVDCSKSKRKIFGKGKP